MTSFFTYHSGNFFAVKRLEWFVRSASFYQDLNSADESHDSLSKAEASYKDARLNGEQIPDSLSACYHYLVLTEFKISLSPDSEIEFSVPYEEVREVALLLYDVSRQSSFEASHYYRIYASFILAHIALHEEDFESAQTHFFIEGIAGLESGEPLLPSMLYSVAILSGQCAKSLGAEGDLASCLHAHLTQQLDFIACADDIIPLAMVACRVGELFLGAASAEGSSQEAAEDYYTSAVEVLDQVLRRVSLENEMIAKIAILLIIKKRELSVDSVQTNQSLLIEIRQHFPGIYYANWEFDDLE